MSWDVDVPANSVTVASLPGHIRAVKTGILDEDNMASDSATDVASQQSIKAYVDSGTVTMINKTLTSVAVNGTGVTLAAGADLIGSSTSDITINTDKFTVAGATGNTVIDGTCAVGGTLDVTGNIDPTTYETTNGGFLDEDDMASAATAADKVCSQQSIKAYVDTTTAARQPVGTVPTLNDSEANAMLKAHAYRTQGAGWVTAFTPAAAQGTDLKGYVDTDSNPASGGQLMGHVSSENNDRQFISFSVGFESSTGIFFEITHTNQNPTITWTPLEVGTGAPIDQD